MKSLLFSVRDIKAENFNTLMMFRRKEEAIRSFSIACNSSDTDFFKYAEDYSLWIVGEFDHDTGILLSYPTPMMLITAVSASEKHRSYYASISNLPDDVSVVPNVA